MNIHQQHQQHQLQLTASSVATNMPGTTTTPALSVKDGVVYANSYEVAKFFEKEHKNVLQSIKENMGLLSAEFSAQWFHPSTRKQKVGFGYRNDPTFDMTRDGFSLLAMGFTGSKALKFKIAYIEAYNQMEAVI